uniref:C2 domain-containing protein n=1 Tax=Parastrongyloides trichosuri TaxID=131310 RepID=A0A0N4ZCH1_PARTI
MDRLAACHVMHGFLNIHKGVKKRNSSLPGNHGKKSGHRSHSLSEKKGAISALKNEYRKHGQTHHQSSGQNDEENQRSFNSIFHTVLDVNSARETLYHHQIESLIDPINKMTLSQTSKFKTSEYDVDGTISPKHMSLTSDLHKSRLKCGYLLLSITYLDSMNQLILHINRASELPISQPHKKSVSYIKAVLIQNHQYVNCIKSAKFSSAPSLYFNETFTFKLTKNQPTLSLLILVIQKSNNNEERELGHLILTNECEDGNSKVDILSSGKDKHLYRNEINQYGVNEVSKQNEMIPLNVTIGSRRSYNNYKDCLLNEYDSKLDNEFCNWFKLSNKW